MATASQTNTRVSEDDTTERGPGKTDGASLSGVSGKFTSRSGHKSETQSPSMKTTIKSSANKQPGHRSPKGSGAPTAAAGTARKGHRIDAARQSRTGETIH